MQLFLEKRGDLTFFGKGRPVVTCTVQGHILFFCFCLVPCWGSVGATEVWQSASAVSGALGSSYVSHPLHTLLKVSNAVNRSDKLSRGRFIGLVIRLMPNGGRLCPLLPRYQIHISLILYVIKSSFSLWKFHKLSPLQERQEKMSCTILLPP